MGMQHFAGAAAVAALQQGCRSDAELAPYNRCQPGSVA